MIRSLSHIEAFLFLKKTEKEEEITKKRKQKNNIMSFFEGDLSPSFFSSRSRRCHENMETFGMQMKICMRVLAVFFVFYLREIEEENKEKKALALFLSFSRCFFSSLSFSLSLNTP